MITRIRGGGVTLAVFLWYIPINEVTQIAVPCVTWASSLYSDVSLDSEVSCGLKTVNMARVSCTILRVSPNTSLLCGDISWLLSDLIQPVSCVNKNKNSGWNTKTSHLEVVPISHVSKKQKKTTKTTKRLNRRGCGGAGPHVVCVRACVCVCESCTHLPHMAPLWELCQQTQCWWDAAPHQHWRAPGTLCNTLWTRKTAARCCGGHKCRKMEDGLVVQWTGWRFIAGVSRGPRGGRRSAVLLAAACPGRGGAYSGG